MPASSRSPAELARQTLTRLAALRLPPTPAHYARIYAEVAGEPEQAAGPDPAALLGEMLRDAAARHPELAGVLQELEQWRSMANWQPLLQRLLQGLTFSAGPAGVWGDLCKRLVREWERRQAGLTYLQKQEALDRLVSSRGADPQGFALALAALLQQWAALPERSPAVFPPTPPDEPEAAAGPSGRLRHLLPSGQAQASPVMADAAQVEAFQQWREVLVQALRFGVVPRLACWPHLQSEAERLLHAAERVEDGAALAAFARELKQFWIRVELQGNADVQLQEGLIALLRLFTENITELLIEDQWLAGQMASIQGLIQPPLDLSALKRVEEQFKEVIYKQGFLKQSILEAREALKSMAGLVIGSIEQVSLATGEYYQMVQAHAAELERTEDLNEINRILRDILQQSKGIEEQTRRLHAELLAARRQVESAEGRIRSLEQELEEVSQLIQEDPLTGVLNRRGMASAFGREFSRAQRLGTPLSVALLDIDHFKTLNDSYGHDLGDQVLKHLVKVFGTALRPTDILARSGGEEFVILLPDTDLDQAEQVLTRLQQILARAPFPHHDTPLPITFSAGIARWHAPESVESLLERADRAMYQAKKAGRNRVMAAEQAGPSAAGNS